jgi:hypothetical protein
MTRSSTRQPTEARSLPGSESSSAKRGEAQSPAPFAWRSWPVVDEWRRTWLIAATVALISLVIGIATGRFDLALLALGVQAAVLWRLWLPIHYEINARGIEQRIFRRTVKTPWTAIRRHELRRDGVLIFREADARPFDAWRGVYLPWSRNQAAVIASLARIIHRDDGY